MYQMRLRKKKLEMILSRLHRNPDPDPRLEQYELSPQSASEAIIKAWENGDIEGKKVCDLGCGTGILAIGAALSGARKVCGVDLDPVALDVARENINIAEGESGSKIGCKINLIRIDVAEIDSGAMGAFDTVIQNPPFGVQQRSSDRIFIRKALELAPTVYSIHKGHDYVERFLNKFVPEVGGKVEGRVGIEVPIPRQFDFHRRTSYSVKADLYTIRRIEIDSEES
jgi:putative methylase